MKYTVEDLIKEKKDWSKDDFIFFWKIHKGKEVNKSCLSQWYPSEFIIKGRRYNCAEQYMMAQKALLFEDEESYKKIIASSEPKEIKALGREVKGFDSVKWDEEKNRIVREGNFAKFTQKQELRDYLVSTEGKILVEASPYDNVWGIEMHESNSDILNPAKWKGQNLLGFILMDIRDEIIERIKEPEFIEWEEDLSDIPEECLFKDGVTGEFIKKILRRQRNEKYLENPQEIWDSMLDVEKDRIIREIPLSDRLKIFLSNHLTTFPINKNIDNLTGYDLEILLNYPLNIGFEIGNEHDDGKWRAYVRWNHETYESNPFETYIEALEEGTIDLIENIESICDGDYEDNPYLLK